MAEGFGSIVPFRPGKKPKPHWFWATGYTPSLYETRRPEPRNSSREPVVGRIILDAPTRSISGGPITIDPQNERITIVEPFVPNGPIRIGPAPWPSGGGGNNTFVPGGAGFFEPGVTPGSRPRLDVSNIFGGGSGGSASYDLPSATIDAQSDPLGAAMSTLDATLKKEVASGAQSAFPVLIAVALFALLGLSQGRK